MQVFNQWQDELDPKAKAALKQQLDQLSTDQPTELVSLMTMRDNLDDTPASKEKLLNINNRIKKITEFAPPVAPSAVRTQIWEEEQGLADSKAASSYMQDAYDVTSPLNDTDLTIENKTRKSPDFESSKLSTRVDEAKGKSSTIAAVERLQTLMNKEGFKSGPLDQYVNELLTMAPEELGLANHDNIMANAGINAEVASIIKELSGAAASDSERLSTLQSVVGAPYADEGTRRTTLEGWLEGERGKLAHLLKQLANDGLPKTAKGLNIQKKKKPYKANNPQLERGRMLLNLGGN